MTEKNLVDRINPEIRECLVEMGAGDFFKCYQCGKCASICPWFMVDAYDFPVYRFPIEAALGMIASSEDKDELARDVDRIYRCVGCEACVNQCPHGIDIPKILRAGRRLLVDFGSYPETLKATVRRIHDTGNPLGEARDKRTSWADDLDVPRFTPEMEYLYFSCCISCYDPRVKEVARALVGLLKSAGVSFGILSGGESCCGEAIRRMGAEEVFTETARANIAAFEDAGAKRVLVTSPHCLVTFRDEYPELGGTVEAIHATQLLAELISQGKLKPTGKFEKRVVYHDPCCLGRQSGIYEEPRAILRSIPGLELVEVEDFNRSLGICCGAGSGALWLEWEREERMADARIRQLAATGAGTIAVACPYCHQMIEETWKSMGLDLEVMDVVEILARSCLL